MPNKVIQRKLCLIRQAPLYSPLKLGVSTRIFQGNPLYAIYIFSDLAQIDPEDYRIFGELGFLLYQRISA